MKDRKQLIIREKKKGSHQKEGGKGKEEMSITKVRGKRKNVLPRERLPTSEEEDD